MGFRADQMSDLEGGEQIEDPKFDVECAIKVCVQMTVNLTPSQTSTDTVNPTPSQT